MISTLLGLSVIQHETSGEVIAIRRQLQLFSLQLEVLHSGLSWYLVVGDMSLESIQAIYFASEL